MAKTRKTPRIDISKRSPHAHQASASSDSGEETPEVGALVKRDESGKGDDDLAEIIYKNISISWITPVFTASLQTMCHLSSVGIGFFRCEVSDDIASCIDHAGSDSKIVKLTFRECTFPSTTTHEETKQFVEGLAAMKGVEGNGGGKYLKEISFHDCRELFHDTLVSVIREMNNNGVEIGAWKR